jgi:hypothetical protein
MNVEKNGIQAILSAITAIELNDPAQITWKKLLRKKFTANDAIVVAVNLIPLIGVWAWQWDAKEMFLVYCLETVIVGGYNVLQMLLTAIVKKKDVWDDSTGTMMPGLFFVFFFIIHYGFFVFIQLSLFLSIIHLPGLDGLGSAFTFLFHFPDYLGRDALIVLLLFVFSYGVMMTRKHLWSGAYKTASMGMLMFTPYPRIFVQQFVVILGSFVLVFGARASGIFMLIFVTVKILFELVLDFDQLFEEYQRKQPEKTS